MIYLPPDLELWLTTWLRARLHDVRVTNKEPTDLTMPLACPLVVIRDDGGPQLDLRTFDRSIGVTILAGSKTSDKPANDLARLVYAHLTGPDIIADPTSPICDITDPGCNGPTAVTDDHDYARRYLTTEYTVTGSIQ
ncbi:MAG: hypothetical protein SOI66_05205 [Bifidobacterium sp.]|jgi:hypothetical protein